MTGRLIAGALFLLALAALAFFALPMVEPWRPEAADPAAPASAPETPRVAGASGMPSPGSVATPVEPGEVPPPSDVRGATLESETSEPAATVGALPPAAPDDPIGGAGPDDSAVDTASQPAVDVAETSEPVGAEADARSPASGRDTAAAEDGTPEADTDAALAADGPAEPDAADDLGAPVFDLVRVEADGSAVIAGRAPPGAEVTIRIGEDEVGRTVADESGGFVALLSLGPSEAPRVVTLGAEKDGERSLSRATVILQPSRIVTAEAGAGRADGATAPGAEDAAEESPDAGAGPTNAAAAAPEDATPGVAGDSVVTPENTAAAEAAGDEGSEPVDAPAAGRETRTAALTTASDAPPPAAVAGAENGAGTAASTETEPDATAAAAPRVMLAGPEGIRVVQEGGAGPAVPNVSVDAISYDSSGEVALSGRATGAGGVVRVYIDNRPLIEASADADGQWRADLPEIDTGTYTLRVDEIDRDGQVLSRAETPFRREPAEAIREIGAAMPETSGVSLLTVQPGNTLWGIAEGRWGEGILYVRVFEANADRIRDPDLIYPGQIFALPE